MRYPDHDLREFEILINNKITQAKENLTFLQSEWKNENSTDDTARNFKLEEGNDFSREERNLLIFRQKKHLESLENALVRVKNKTFGVCQLSGELINKERLRIVPYVTRKI